MPNVFDTLLLLALPASGKSETRTFLTHENPAEFHMGPTVQLDDYPYVHLQILVDEALHALGHAPVYHHAERADQRNGPFQDVRELPGLIRLLNEDYACLRRGRAEVPANPGARLLERFDAASVGVGARPKFAGLSADLRAQVAAAIDEDARKAAVELAESCPPSLDGKTIVIEFARGGPPGDTMPLPPHMGYAGSLPHLASDLLARACILYIWVDPADSRRKNRERARPDGAGSILFHGTPESVMEAEYSRCDMHHLIETAPVPGTVRVNGVDGRAYDVPVARFDNRQDLTTFLRKPRAEWQPDEIARIHGGLRAACDALWTTHSRLRG